MDRSGLEGRSGRSERLSADEAKVQSAPESVIIAAERQVVLSVIETGRALRTIRDAGLYREAPGPLRTSAPSGGTGCRAPTALLSRA